MDSDDDDHGSGGGGGEDEDEAAGAAGGASSSADEAAGKKPPLPASFAEVETFSEMVRYIESLPRGKILRMPMDQLGQLCKAAARVKYFDGAVVADVTSAVKVHVRGRASVRPEHIADVLEGLAEINAYERELFELAIQALPSLIAGQLDSTSRSRIVAAVKKTKHEPGSEAAREVLEAMRLQHKFARYEQACNEVAACWQKAGCISSSAMSLSM